MSNPIPTSPVRTPRDYSVSETPESATSIQSTGSIGTALANNLAGFSLTKTITPIALDWWSDNPSSAPDAKKPVNPIRARAKKYIEHGAQKRAEAISKKRFPSTNFSDID